MRRNTDEIGSSTAGPCYPTPVIRTDLGRLFFLHDETATRANAVWDKLWRVEWPGHIAVGVGQSERRLARLKQSYRIELDDKPFRTAHWTREWGNWLRENLYVNAALMQLPGDCCPALDVPGAIHGQSQGITDLFGAQVELQPDGNFYVNPLPADPQAIVALTTLPVEKSMYWRAVEYIRYARAATHGALPFHNPIMTGPLDTANYLLGTTILLEWVHTQPEALHSLLDRITDVLIRMIAAVREAAGHAICPHHLRCVRGSHDLASEVRSLVSREIYEQFEAPYLRRIGESLGPFSAHSCGNWERSVPSMVNDPNFRAMNGQIKENDLATLCDLADGGLTLSIGRSINVQDRFMWPDTRSYYQHILETAPEGHPLELIIETEDEIELWDELHRRIRGKPFPWTAPLFPGSSGFSVGIP